MKVKTKKGIAIASALLFLIGLASPLFLRHNAIETSAEPETSEVSSSEEPVVSSSEESQPVEEPKWVIKEAAISYRDDESAPYTPCADNPQKIGSYFLSAEGWGEEDAEDIIMNVKGAIATKLEGKVMFIYEYRPTLVMFAGKGVAQNADKTFTLKKPEAAGQFDLSICFTKTLVVNPVELTNLDWSSLLTVPNLMTILSWAVIVVFFIVFFFLSRKYKKEGNTSLQSIKKSLIEYVDSNFGAEVSAVVADAFDKVVKKSFDQINGKLEKMDNNSAVMVRCLLLMQENTPEARLAITECLSKLDVAEDNKSAEVKALIESEIKKYKDEQEAKQAALAKAKELNESWSEHEVDEKPEPKDDGDDADGGYGSL